MKTLEVKRAFGNKIIGSGKYSRKLPDSARILQKDPLHHDPFDERWLKLEKLHVQRSRVAREICFSVDRSKICPQPSTVYTQTQDREGIDQDIVHDRYGMDIGSTDWIYRSGFRIHLRTV